MFEVIESFLMQFVEILPYLIPLILIFNLIASILWGRE